MIGSKTKWSVIQVSVTVYPEHVRIIERIKTKKYSKPIAHKSVSEIIRRAIEHYAEFLGVTISDS